MAKKPSFFEKLTGASWSENESIKEKQKEIKASKTKIKSSKTDTAQTKIKPIKKDVYNFGASFFLF